MAGGSLGSLTIDLAANITRFERSLTRAERLADKRAKGIQRTFRRMATGIGAALVSFGFVRAVEQSLDFADAIGKTADKLGIATDSLQEYRFAAEQTGVQQAALDIGIQRFTRRLGEAQEGTGVLSNILKDLGINLKDNEGNFKSTETVLGEYANAIKNADNEQQQLLLAFKAFDTEGVALVNLMRQGEKGINAFRREAQELGIVMDEELIRNAEKANDQLNIMSQVMKVHLTEAAVALAPALTDIGETFADLVKGDVQKLPDWLKTVAVGFKAVDFAAGEATQFIGTFGAAVTLLLGGEFKALSELFAENRDRTSEAKDALQEYVDLINSVATQPTPEAIPDGLGASGLIDTNTEQTNSITGQTAAEMDADFAAYEAILGDAARAHTTYLSNKQALEMQFTAFTKANDRAAFGEAVGLLSALGAKHKSFAIAAIALQKGLAIAEVIISTQAGAMKALEIYGPTPAGYAAAAHVETIGAIRVGLIAATGLAQAASLNSGGASTGATGTLGTDFNPVITATDSTVSGGTTGTITINVNGVVTDEILQDLIIPAIQDATNDKDVILFNSDSRQAIELTA